jgi:formylglycine-generating enzyme required for sulfatase activity
MRRCIQLPLLAACAVLLSGCDKGVPGAGNKTGESASLEVMTASGTAMVYVAGGSFTMGSNKGNPDEMPPHKVSVGSFLMDKYEVTSAQYITAQLPNPSHWHENPKNPVERVRWRDAKQYCNERSLLEKLTPCYSEKTPDWDCDMTANGYRLPTEAEWEYACRAGTDGDYEFGGADRLRQHAWFGENGEKKTHSVGQKKPNRWGIYDLYGNVSEWCEDVYSPTYYRASPATDPTGPPNTGADVRRVIRGGSWMSSTAQCRSSARQGEKTGDSDACFATDFCGFRCVRRVTEAELAALLGK